ncbi:hypothetical protein BV25DRAFT_1920839 [Artomyces pyxidatus]|uniref:Uncharacterized protein n=1 Tax=Artomyces pyxidatus TaxID=48021 RepID=A0ACB8SK51_9AGAM|nr:hypothetical protein BV25DRAFT_1920839 [Artomyces pyxidatus]
MHVHILLLSDEILLIVLENLDYKALLACQATCHRLGIATKSLALQYKIELGACGMLDGRPGLQTTNLSQRLGYLKEYSSAWRQLKWTTNIQLPHLVGKVPSNSNVSLMFCPPNALLPRVFQTLPSKLRGTHEAHYSLAPQQYDLSIKVDPSQDLAIYLESPLQEQRTSCYRLQSLSTGERHPLAFSQGIDGLSIPAMYRAVLDVRGDLLLEQCHTILNERFYIVWNWMTGHMEFKKQTKPRNSRAGCRFLDDEHIILEVDAYGDDVDSSACLRVLPFRGCTDRTVGTVADATTYLFMLHPSMKRTGTVPESEAAMGPIASSAHFYGDHDGCLLSTCISVATLNDSTRDSEAILDVPSHTITSYMRHHPTTKQSVVLWDLWGPRGTRITWNPLSRNHVMGSYVCGMKRTMLKRIGNGLSLTVTDYHPRRVARALSRGDGGAIVPESDLKGSVCGGLSTTLPCLVSEKLIPDVLDQLSPSFTFRIGEDGIVFMALDVQDRTISRAWAQTI